MTVLENGHLVSRISDFTIYSVEAEFIGQVVSEYGPCECFCGPVLPSSAYQSMCYQIKTCCNVMIIRVFLLSLSARLFRSHSSNPDHSSIFLASKVGAIVAGQTSVKAPEKAAFEKYLPQDVQIVSCHSLHGPTVSPEGQPLVCKFVEISSAKRLSNCLISLRFVCHRLS